MNQLDCNVREFAHFMAGVIFGTILTLAGMSFAQQDNPYWSMTPMEQQQFDRQQMLGYNFNRALQQHNFTQPVRPPC